MYQVNHYPIRKVLLVAVFVTAAAGCGNSDEGGGAKIDATLKSASSGALLLGGDQLELAAASNMGQSTAAGLKSLKYYISGVSICQEMTLSGGTSFSNPRGCISIYSPEKNPDPKYDYTPGADYNNLGDVARANSEGFIDLIDPASRAKLSTSTIITKDNVGEYKYGIITWYPVVKMTAEVAVASSPSGYLRTADGVSSTVGGYATKYNGAFSAVDVAAEAVTVLGNGGNWFKFQKPLSVTQADVDSKTGFALDLTLNPDGLVKAFSAGYADGCGICTLKDAVANPVNANAERGNALTPPAQIALIPIAHKSDDVVMKEVYVGSVEGSNAQGSDAFDLRIELYYLQSDSTKSIYGAEVRTLINASTNTFVNEFSKISLVKENGDQTVDLQKHDAAAVISALARQSVIGAETSATIRCSALDNGGFTFRGCGQEKSDPTSKDVLLVLKSVSKVQ